MNLAFTPASSWAVLAGKTEWWTTKFALWLIYAAALFAWLSTVIVLCCSYSK
jgi:hypothetical protein